MDYKFQNDLEYIREILGLTQVELAQELEVQPVTISRHELGNQEISDGLLEKTYSFAFQKGVRINKLKEMFLREELAPNHKMLFHGAKDGISGRISAKIGKKNNDFGRGFYAGETYEQAVSFVSGVGRSSVYYLDFDNSGLKCKNYNVDRDWMLTIAYYRETLGDYENHPIIKQLIAEVEDADYLIAPIADNRMFRIIHAFISGEITDEQCKHCLSAINLGMQYVFLTDRAVDNIRILERCYIAQNERKYYDKMRSDDSRIGEDKVKLARIKYRGQGKYIDEILSEKENL